MTAKDYLNRPFILNNKINDKKIKLGFYRELSCSPSSPGFEEHFSSNQNTKAPFVRYLEKIDDLERLLKIIKSLMRLKPKWTMQLMLWKIQWNR